MRTTRFRKIRLIQHFPSFVYLINYGKKTIVINMPAQLEGTIMNLPEEVANILVKKRRAIFVEK